MNILAFADLHGDMKKFQAIKKKSQESDILLCAGDLTVFEANLDQFLNELESLNKHTLIIHGNHESDSILRKKCASMNFVKFLHRKVFKHKDFMFFGWGGEGFSDRDEEFERKQKDFEKVLKGKKFVMMTHQPPYNTKVDFINTNHVGNKSYRQFIARVQPKAHISGHIHETSKAQDRIGKCLIINPGPDGVILKIP